MRNLQEQVKKAFYYQKLFWPFTVWINCSSDHKIFANSRPSASNFKSFSWSLEQYFLTKGQNIFGNKIPLPKMKLSLQLGLQQRFIKRPWQFFLHHGNSFLAGREIVEHECKVVHHHFSLDLEFCSSAASGFLLTNSFFQCLDLMPKRILIFSIAMYLSALKSWHNNSFLGGVCYEIPCISNGQCSIISQKATFDSSIVHFHKC